MIAVPLTILALAAGVLLLIKVKKDNLGMLYNLLSWLVVLLSILFLIGTGVRAYHHHREGRMGGWHEECHRMEQCDGSGPSCNMSNGGNMDKCPMGGCHMEGDSVVLDKDACEKAMGKEACEKLIIERGRCIVSKDECAKMCTANGASCCMNGAAGGSATHSSCCMDKGAAGKADSTKSCCKK